VGEKWAASGGGVVCCFVAAQKASLDAVAGLFVLLTASLYNRQQFLFLAASCDYACRLVGSAAAVSVRLVLLTAS